MRTTIDIDDAIYESAKIIAATERKSIGKVISALALKGLENNSRLLHQGENLPVFQISKNDTMINLNDIRRLIQDDGLPVGH